MKLERKNYSPALDTDVVLNQLERTMLASIAMMKRLRRERKRSGRILTGQGFDHKVDHSAEIGSQA